MNSTAPASANQSRCAEPIPDPLRLPRHRATLALARQSGRDRHQTAGLLLDLAAWAEGQAINLAATPVTAEMLVDVLGADRAFWSAVAAAGWLMLDDSPTPQHADNTSPIEFDKAVCEYLADRLFAKLGVKNDGQILWRLAMLMASRRIRESIVWNAVEGVRQKKPNRPIGYFRTSLANALGGVEKLEALLNQVLGCPDELDRPPENEPLPLAFEIKGVPASKPRSSREVVAEIAAMTAAGAGQ